MEKQFRKYINSTCNPEEFSEVIESLCAKENDDKVRSDIRELWNESMCNEFDRKENSQLLLKIQHRILIEESNKVNRRFSLYKNLFRIAAIFIIGLLAYTTIFYNNIQEKSYSSLSETVTTPYGARTNFRLSDGSEVWLNSGSTISFPKQFGKQRNVELRGQAFFKVVKDGKPFIVNTNLGKVEVMGTSFDVKAYSNENFQTTLVEGSVKVRNRMNLVATLKPGQQSVITPNHDFSCNEVNAGLITSWRDGKLIFVNEPFQNVAKELERWYNVKIELQGEKLKDLGYTGSIEMETFSEVLELINFTTPIKYEFNTSTRVLKISGK